MTPYERKWYQQKYQRATVILGWTFAYLGLRFVLHRSEVHVAEAQAAKKKAKPKKRKHPGVVLIKPDPARRIGWRGRYWDPDAQKTVKESLDAVDAKTEKAREDWAVRKYKELERRKLELEAGAVPKTGTPIDVAIKRYFDDHPRLRPKTVTAYRGATDKFEAWAKTHRVKTCDDLTRGKLVSFAKSLEKEPKRSAKAGGKRGQREATEATRSAHSVNRELRAVRTVLGYLRRLDLLPKLDNDALADGLQRLKVTHERLDFLRATDLRELLRVALRHDGETYRETRAEHVGRGRKAWLEGSRTPKYEPVAPLVAFVLLTGMRFGEAIGVTWDMVDLEALDHEGRKVGEIHLKGSGTKTGRARTLGLEVSPALRSLLVAMKATAPVGEARVFPMSRETAEAAGKRLKSDFGAPASFGWQALRRTCGTFLTNAPGIYGAASAFMSAKQLGHSVTIAERHYAGVLRGIPREARTLEAAMGVETELERVVKAVRGENLPANLVAIGGGR